MEVCKCRKLFQCTFLYGFDLDLPVVEEVYLGNGQTEMVGMIAEALREYMGAMWFNKWKCIGHSQFKMCAFPIINAIRNGIYICIKMPTSKRRDMSILIDLSNSNVLNCQWAMIFKYLHEIRWTCCNTNKCFGIQRYYSALIKSSTYTYMNI